jgi:uncharacterized protein
MTLPTFRYHPDPVRSGSIKSSTATCRCCNQARGYIYEGPAYAEAEFNGALCPWCIADGSAHANFDITFVDSEALTQDVSQEVQSDIVERTPGFNAWQGEHWPACCSDATAFIQPLGSKELRAEYREYESVVLSHIIYEMKISGGAATRLLASLDRDTGPTAYLFRCLTCEKVHVHLDQP